MESPTRTLADRQERFDFVYLKDRNASAAATRAGYSAKSRASQASDLMQNPAVRERVRMELQSLLAELGASPLDLMDFAERDQVLSGSAQTQANTFVFSAAPAAADPSASFAIAEKNQVLSGSEGAAANTSVLPTIAVASAASPTSFEFVQKPQVLSGSPPVPTQSAMLNPARDASGPNMKEVVPISWDERFFSWRGAATELLSRGAYNDSTQKYNSPRVR